MVRVIDRADALAEMAAIGLLQRIVIPEAFAEEPAAVEQRLLVHRPGRVAPAGADPLQNVACPLHQ
jgi:hypothetical protein